LDRTGHYYTKMKNKTLTIYKQDYFNMEQNTQIANALFTI